ncbi:hypothetical protein [Oceanobacillus luteolus]|uniref:Uncharacterized protein n=1 Tax=Oceanobacillus luteolus TaxID=1274358 RepID=A0ABW4HS80_9BACI
MDTIITIVSSLVGGVIGVFLTHIFYQSKLKKEQKARFQEEIGKRIAKSLMEVREIAKAATYLEVYEIANILEESPDEFDIHNTTKYPSIMNNKESFLEFHSTIMAARGNYGNEIPIDVAAYLWYAEKYFNHLLVLIGSFEKVDMPSLGAIFLKDIIDWQRSFDNLLVKRINTPVVKLELHFGTKWNRAKVQLLERLWEKSLLKRVINDDTSNDMDIVWEVIAGYK